MSKSTLDRILSGDHRAILERLITGTETGQKMVDELEGARTQERRALAAELSRLTATSSTEINEANLQLQTAAAARAETQKILDQVSADEARAREVLARNVNRLSRDRARIQGRLYAIADPQIVDFRDELSQEINACRRPRTSQLGTEGAQVALRSKLSARQRALKAALAVVEQLLLEPLDAVEIGERIAAMRTSLPPDPGGQVGTLVGIGLPR